MYVNPLYAKFSHPKIETALRFKIQMHFIPHADDHKLYDWHNSYKSWKCVGNYMCNSVCVMRELSFVTVEL